MAYDGTINITGNVVATTCQINGQATPATVAVALPTVSASAIAPTAGKTPFKIALTGCTGGATTVHTYFEPGSTINANGRLTSGVTNVDVELLNGNDSTPIVLGVADASQNSHTTPIVAGAATQNYFAQYRSGGSPGTGAVSTSVTFSIAYQ